METTAKTTQDDKVSLETTKEDGHKKQSSSELGQQATTTDKNVNQNNAEETDSRNSATRRNKNKKSKHTKATDALTDRPEESTKDPDPYPHRETKQDAAYKARPRSSRGKRKNAMQFDSQKPSGADATKSQGATPKKDFGGSSRDKKKGSRTPNKHHPSVNGGDTTPTKGEHQSQSTPRSASRGQCQGNPTSKSRNYGGTPNKNKNFKPFEDYLSLEEVSDGLKRKRLLQGAIRINPRNFEESYLAAQDGGADIFLNGLTARNRALEGDVVVVEFLHKSKWKLMEDDYQRYKQMGQKESKSKSTSKPKTEEAVLAKQLKDLKIESLQDKSAMNPTGEAAEITKDELALGKHDKADCLTFEKSSQSERPETENQASKGLDTKSQDEGGSLQEETDSIVKRLFPEEDKKEQGMDEEIPERFYQRLAKVVYIVERSHSRACSGKLRPPPMKNAPNAVFSPSDYRVPRIYIPVSECPEGFLERPGDFESTLFIARIDEWPYNSPFALGHLHRSLGEAGEIEPETEGMLMEHGVDYSDFSDEVIACLPKNLPWTIPQDEIAKRRSFRDECVFTIDPATARDLDDALSCVALGDGEYEVGVHIADVSFFVDENNALDEVAGLRATSVYLVQKVIPMLPRLLCEHLCSLNPNEDKLTFSFLWRLTENGEILDEWCGRSVIRSCVKMSYAHAQGIITEPERVWTPEEMPTITNGFTIPDIVERVLNLNKIAQNMRKKRSDDGALRLDQVKLLFTLDKESGLPSGYNVYQQKESNKLVEEFMLLANMAAAHRIYNAYKDTALLRRHPPPKTKMIDDLILMCSEIGLKVDGSSSKSIQESLNRYIGPVGDKASWGKGQILTVFYSKPMQRAKYFCTGSIEVEDHFRHYALNVPFYTHFTSPIRRYADIIVHRQLAASLGVGPASQRDEVTIQDQAVRCNERKDAAKKVSDMSGEMFFAIFVRECGPLKQDAMVMHVLDRAIDVLVMELGVVKRVYCNALPLKSFKFEKQGKQGLMKIVWEPDHMHPEEETQTLQLFSLVKVELKAGKEPLKFDANLIRPE
ncbi:DIS3-like exonuclease 2 [Asterias rubens]|uniref:DIS3-like exonuclease 2 n=1 Tax=Asterias rubens TaxID=7604 RepID=UPI001455B74E|nr:DIS3-like exonuclease 2 [Asterias rubens]